MSRKILGLDIRNDALSAVLLTTGIKGAAIDAHEHVAFPQQVDFESGLKAALESLVSRLDLSNTLCAASFPAEHISYRNIRVPFKGLKKIRQILPYELEPLLPVAVDEQIIDFVAMTSSGHGDQTDIIAASVEKTALKIYLDTLASYGIDPEVVTVGGYPAASRLARLKEPPQNMLILDIDASHASIFAVLSGEVCMIRALPLRSADGTLSAQTLVTGVQQTLSALADRFDLDFQPQRAYIIGACPGRPDFEREISRLLELEFEHTDMAEGFEMPEHDPLHPSEGSHRPDNALALALMQTEGTNGFNFRKGPFEAKRFWVEHKKSLVKTGVLAALVLAAMFANVLLDAHVMQKKMARLNAQIEQVFTSTFPDVKKIVDPYQQMRSKIESAKKTAISTTNRSTHIRAIDILNDISRLIPESTDAILTRLVIGPESVAISGDTNTFNAVDDIKNRLEQSGFFKKITITSANIDRTDNRIRFKLKVNL